MTTVRLRFLKYIRGPSTVEKPPGNYPDMVVDPAVDPAHVPGVVVVLPLRRRGAGPTAEASNSSDRSNNQPPKEKICVALSTGQPLFT